MDGNTLVLASVFTFFVGWCFARADISFSICMNECEEAAQS